MNRIAFAALFAVCAIVLSITVRPVVSFAADRTFYVDLGNQWDNTSDSGWNNINDPRAGFATTLKDSAGATSNVSFAITDAFYTNSSSPTGASANKNGTTSSGLYPANATKDSFFVDSGNPTAQFSLSGLTASSYTVRFYTSRMASDTSSRVGQYTIGGTTVELNATNNVSNVATINNVTPVNGTVSISLARKSGSGYAYLGVLEVIPQ